MLDFANSVARLCIDKYESLKKTGKPVNNEWTVLAAVVSKDIDNVLTLVSLATGTKCLSGLELVDTKLYEIGDRLSDSHAEILARRGFVLYLYDQIDLLLSTGKSDVFTNNTNEQIVIKPGVTFHFYCSQTPCGDCSIIPVKKDDSCDTDVAAKKRKLTVESGNGEDSVSNDGVKTFEDIHRTGAKCLSNETRQDARLSGIDYHVTGPLRTKPGRGAPTLSLSCSDKIAKWIAVGVQGSLLSYFIAPLHLKTIVIGAGCPYSRKAMERGLYKRFGDDLNAPDILRADERFSHMRNSTRAHPCPSSILWCAVRNRNTEVTINGRKQGATKNKKGNSLLVSRRTLLRNFLRIADKSPLGVNAPRHPKKIFYYHCKQWCDSYQTEWKRVKATKFLAWPKKPAILQNFAL